jgi:methyl-accepting chemotaxis protein WspA
VARASWRERLSPEFEGARAAIQEIVDEKKAQADASMEAISYALRSAQLGMLGSFLGAVLSTFVCAFFLLRAITNPLNQLLAIVEVMRSGDFSKRLNLERQDEFHALANGCNRMADELTGLVAEVQARPSARSRPPRSSSKRRRGKLLPRRSRSAPPRRRSRRPAASS